MAIRHLGRALVHDTVYRRAARTLVPVAQTVRPRPASQNASAFGTASAGTVLPLREEQRDGDAGTVELPRMSV